jgi:hypothetical protein
VAVNIYVVVLVGVTVVLLPVTVPMPLPMLTVVAFVTVHESVAVVVPMVTGFRIDGVAVKLVMEGAATTVTAACAVTDAPAAFVAVSV